MEIILSKYTNGILSYTDILSLLWIPRARFWFLYALFLFSVAALIFKRLYPNHKAWLFFLFLGMYLFGEYSLIVPLYYVFGNLVFFYLGIVFPDYMDGCLARSKRFLLPTLFLFLITQYVFHWRLGLTYDTGGIPGFILTVCSLAFVIDLCMVLSNYLLNGLSCLGYSSLVTYLLHIFATDGTRIVLQKILHVNDASLHLMAGCILGIPSPLVIYSCFNRNMNCYLIRMPVCLLFESFYRKIFRT